MVRPRTAAERHLVEAAREVAAEQRNLGVGPGSAWLRVNDLISIDAVDPYLRAESSLEGPDRPVRRTHLVLVGDPR